MSFLCKSGILTYNKNKLSPFPTLRKNLNPCKNLLPVKSTLAANCIKGTSLLTLLKKSVKASMTVETALVLPLFCFFMIHMGSAIEMIRLHGNLEVALWDAGRQIGIYGTLLRDTEQKDDTEQELLKDRVEPVVLSYTYIRSRIREQLGEEYLEEAPLHNGINGLQFWESEIRGDIYEIAVTYKMSSRIPIPGFREFRMANRYYGHLWNGYEIPGAEETEQYVYITKGTEVYHTDRECTHIRLSVRPVAEADIPDGYLACTKCIGQWGEDHNGTEDSVYYVCTEGERYHRRRDCPGIRRNIYRIRREEAEGYRECARCRKTREDG